MPRESRRYPLTTELYFYRSRYSKKILVGNSGLSFTFDDEYQLLYQDFYPDDAHKPSKNAKEQLRRSLMYAGALYEFLTYYEGHRYLYYIVANLTNGVMSNYMKGLLTTEHYRSIDLAPVEGIPYNNFEFDMRHLVDDEKLMAKLKLMYLWLIRLNYKMKRQVSDIVAEIKEQEKELFDS